jgi:diguanylate cyclase (GGDEF)-like protein
VSDSGDDDRSIVAVLEELRLTADLDGLAVLDLDPEAAAAPLAYGLGPADPEVIALGRMLLGATPSRPSHGLTADHRPVLACPWVFPWVLSSHGPGGLLLWRGSRARPWGPADHDLAAGIAMLLRVVIGGGMGQAGIDRLTELPNRRWMLDEADRRIERLDLDGSVGTLVLVDIDDLHGVNVSLGRSWGDVVLVRMANQLRAIVRPGDLVARVGADEFAVWLDGMDHLTAAERAEALCTYALYDDVPAERGVTFSIGIASRDPGSAEDVRTLLRRAHMAAREVKATGGGGWRVARVAPTKPMSDPS